MDLNNIIFSSTAAVYGNPANNNSIKEDEILTPLNPYGQSKIKYRKIFTLEIIQINLIQ